jgi:hypothetical protein
MKLVIFYLTFKSRATKKMRLLLNLEIYFQSIRELLDYSTKRKWIWWSQMPKNGRRGVRITNGMKSESYNNEK